ncbi:MAG: YheU family protein [Pseudomonadota bacterium]|nr:YheU family protein [Pseudomonadota bacterium]MEC8429766.1 YheU family protein [Pseudomonadota bacterium]MEC8472442.1 YheU family protein [Pseudomonadota bacterium]
MVYPNMEIPHSQLSDKALRAIIEEFVTREGSEYGPIEYSFEDKVDHVIQQLERGEVIVTFDAASETCNLIPSR